MAKSETQIQKKICLLGDFSVGKTSLIERFVYNRFDDRYLSTIGVKISRKSISLEQDTIAHLLLWDLAGGEEFSGPQSSYIRGAAGALLVCDLTRGSTLASISKYAQQLTDIQDGTKLVVIANKSDLTQQREITLDTLETITAELNALLFITSAKTGENVEAAFRALARAVVNQPK
jgi:small GTP-binding protein